MDRQNRNECPTLETFGRWINNPVFQTFCGELAKTYGCKESMRYSACSWEPGWNLKFIRAGKTLCTVYPRNGYFTVLAVIGKKEKERVERLLPNMTPRIQTLYTQTREGNGQRWLMVDIESRDAVYEDVMRLIHIRNTKK
ncbi:DUF3788 domain-containing protein [uncultured Dubosiella sp.]|uniref:DUF3788 domain-containing protein n=1 Tax=uncultured Dubosiella sp. TaxID=1937011 RepID=UPI0025B4218D|nr:DUF3788 domain-containing protein [uncultured Dubosiella sp.]